MNDDIVAEPRFEIPDNVEKAGKESSTNNPVDRPGISQGLPKAIKVRTVSKKFDDFEAVKSVSFDVEKGICLGILGPNGAGKTTLLGMMEGLHPISLGSISILNADVGTQIRKVQPHIGVQLQTDNYFKFLSVFQLLSFFQELRIANSGNEVKREIDELLEKVSLLDKKHAKVEELSGGQKQRLSLAIAVIDDPDVIYLDEPTSALDPENRRKVWSFIEELKADNNKTVIITTHSMEEAERLCDELLIMNNGEIVSQGSPTQLINELNSYHEIVIEYGSGAYSEEFMASIDNILEAQDNKEINVLTVKTTNVSETLKKLLDYSEAHGISILQFNFNSPTLEDVFLSITA